MIKFYKMNLDNHKLIKINEKEAIKNNFRIFDLRYFSFIRIKIGNTFVVKDYKYLIPLDNDGHFTVDYLKYSFEEFFEKFPELRSDLLFNIDILK